MMPDEEHHPDTGEILATRAADGSRLPPPAATFADTLRVLNDGQFDLDVSAELRDLIQKIDDHADTKGAAAGAISITLKIKKMNGAHVVTPTIKVTAPVPDQPGTLLFSDEDGRLSRNRADQGVFFGVRDVSDRTGRDVRSV